MKPPGVIAAALWSAGLAVQAQTVTLHYQERPPYSQTGADGQVSGLVATPAARALSQAGIPFRWALTPSQRQLALIQSGSGLHCGIGWFQTAERSERGLFSQPLYRDQAFGALVRAASTLSSGLKSGDLVGDARYTVLLKEGYSYGQQMDALLARAAAPPQRTHVDPPQMARMVAAGRADWMIVAPEEAQALLSADLRLISFSDLPAGPSRHLYCSADLGAERLAGINRALTAAPGSR